MLQIKQIFLKKQKGILYVFQVYWCPCKEIAMTSNLKASDIEVNPLGLTVDTYEVTEEKTIIEDETFLR